MFSLAYAAVTILGLIAASYTDLRERMVPNELNYGLIALGLGLHLFESFYSWTIQPLAFSLAGAGTAFLFSLLLYKTGAWAGGDVKLFTALGALLPFPLGGYLPSAPIYVFPLFPFMILANSAIVAFPFIMFYVFWKTFHRKKLEAEFKNMVLKTFVEGLVFSLSFFGLSSLAIMGGFHPIIVLPVIFGLALLPPRLRQGLAAMLLLMGFIAGGQLETLAFLVVSWWFITGFFEAVTHGMKALRKEFSVGNLEEGMIPGELVLVEEDQPKKIQRSWKQKIFNPSPPGTLVSDLNAAGLTESQIERLKELGVKKLLVKESIPLVPILLLGCTVSLVFGDLAWLLISSV